VTFDFTPSGSSVCNGIKHFGVGVLTVPSDGSVNMAQLGASGTKSSSTFLAGDNTFKTVSGTTINNNADNRVITGSGTANTLEGEANLNFNGSLGVGITTPDTSTYFGKVIHVADGSNAGIMFNRTNSTAAKWSIGCNSSANLDFVKESAVKMRIDPNGQLLINTTSTVSNDSVLQVVGNSNTTASTWKINGDGNIALLFRNSAGDSKGSIVINSNSTAYNTSSDYRLKENEVAISDGIERLKQLKPYKFNFKTEPDTKVDGFFAHEVSSIVPEAISGTKDELEKNKDGTNKLDDDGNTIPKHQGIDQAKLVPLLTSALQEAITKIETLEARVQALENA
jgi:hypothetical protein